jgi:two-component system chemotaxis response regulator CheY
MFATSTRVLIVDDMSTMRKMVRKMCTEMGFTDITEAADGALAWQEISTAKVPFGLIISDWNMPNSTGMDLLKRVRADGRFKQLPFLLVTAESDADQVAEAIKNGVDNYIVKTITPEII